MTKITILCPKVEFTTQQISMMESVASITFTPDREEIPMPQLTKLCKDSQVIAFDPDNIGGFEVAPKRLTSLIHECKTLKGLALGTTSFGYVDLKDCEASGVTVTNVPFYSSESVAEHALGLLLGCAKRIFTSDRATQRGEYNLIRGIELKGKTLGVIGMGHIGTRMAELGTAMGMKVVGWNRTKNLDEVLAISDFVSLHLADNDETKGIISSEKIALMKPGVIIVNTANRDLVDEQALSEALKTGRVDSYAMEAEDLTGAPLGDLSNAFLFKGFGWYTDEALKRNKQIWVENIIALANDRAVNKVSL